jgi:putative flippase GtrA
MKTFLKANTASLTASFCDYLLTILFKQLLHVDAVLSSIAGTVFGGIINFYICRKWVFKSQQVPVTMQWKRYFIIWLGNLLMNISGVYLLIHHAGMHYILAKLLTSVTVGFGYNYPLQKGYVFKTKLLYVEN